MEDFLRYPVALLFDGIGKLICLAAAYLYLFFSFGRRAAVRERVRTQYKGSHLLHGQILLRDWPLWLAIVLFVGMVVGILW